jgi:hypothetical protein
LIAFQVSQDLSPTFGAEFGFSGLRLAAVGAGGSHTLPPCLFFHHRQILFRHFGVCPNLFRRAAGLGSCHLDPQIWGALFTQAMLLIPAGFTADLRRTGRTLDEIGLDLFDGFEESLVVRLFPGSGAHTFTSIGQTTEQTSEDIAGRVQGGGGGSQGRTLEASAITRTTSITLEFKLEALVGAQVGIITGKFNSLTDGCCSNVSILLIVGL